MSPGSRSTGRYLLYSYLASKVSFVGKPGVYAKSSRSDIVCELILTHLPPTRNSMMICFTDISRQQCLQLTVLS